MVTVTKRAEPPPIPPRYVTRTEAADLLGVAYGTILQYERRGKLEVFWTMRPDEIGRMRNAAMYPLEQVLKLPRRAPNPTPENPDELAARAFELLDKGKTVKQLVIELRATPEKLQRIHTQWLELTGAVLEVTDAERAKLVALLGEFQSVEELIDLITVRCAQ